MRYAIGFAVVFAAVQATGCGLYPALTVAHDAGADVPDIVAGDVAADIVTESPPVDSGPDPMASCGAVGGEGENRDCGWTVRTVLPCTPGQSVTAGCSSVCGLGVCPNDGSSDTVLRICACGVPCTAAQALVQNDDSGCASADGAVDHCSRASFVCPACGMFTAIAGGYFELRPITCQIATQ